MNTSKSNFLADALYFSDRNWPIIPLYGTTKGQCLCNKNRCSSPGKHPITRRGLHEASTDRSTITTWWNLHPKANIGILTGETSNLVVIDIDPRHGGDTSWQEWLKKCPTPDTLRVRTGSGGEHYYFRYPAEKITNRTNILPGVDVRGDGGYIVAPGSIHSCGEPYTWSNPDAAIQPLPRELLQLITNRAQKKPQPEKTARCGIPEGQRNDFLCSLAGVLRKYGFDYPDLQKSLIVHNAQHCLPPLTHSEVQKVAQSISRYPSEETWEDPQPLPTMKVKVPNLHTGLIPETLRVWCVDISERMQVPIEFIISPALVALSSVIGRQVGVFPKQDDDWLVIPNLWGCVIARPGAMKSPALSEALYPLKSLSIDAQKTYEQDIQNFEHEKEIYEQHLEVYKQQLKSAVRTKHQDKLDEIKSQIQSIQQFMKNPPKEKRYYTSDATIEKISDILQTNTNGIGVFRDELSGWLSSLDKTGREGDREFYLESWNGYGNFTVDRIQRGTLHVPALCLSIFGGIQPSKIESIITSAVHEGGDGLIQRFQIAVYPDLDKNWTNIDRKPNLKALQDVCSLFKKMSQLDEYTKGLSSTEFSIPGLRFNKEATEIFTDWRSSLEHKLRQDSENSAFEACLSKQRSLVPSLALIFQLCEDLSHNRRPFEISSHHLQMAIQWASLLEQHAHKIYRTASHPSTKSALSLAKKIEDGRVQDKDSLRSIYRRCWQHLESSSKLESAIAILEDHHWVRTESFTKKTKPTELIRINPKLKKSTHV